MTNSYVSLDTLKSSGVLNITGSGDDTRLRTLIEAVSRVVDGHCNRHFYVFKGTKLFDGGGALNLHLPDLVSVDTGGLKTDDNRDRTFETTWAMSDYRLMPSNAAPSDGANPASRPYTRLSVDVESGSKSEFPRGGGDGAGHGPVGLVASSDAGKRDGKCGGRCDNAHRHGVVQG